MKVIMMSHKEFGRLRGLIDLEDGRISVLDAATLAGFGRRQVYQVLASFHLRSALVSKRRGRPSNRAHGAAPSFARPS
jgi:hypothetical protein